MHKLYNDNYMQINMYTKVKYSLLNLWSTLYKFMAPKLEWGILDEFNKGDKESPWVWAVHYQPFQKDSGNLFLDCFRVGFSKEMQEGAAEVVSVTVGVAQLIGDGVQEQVAACIK